MIKYFIPIFSAIFVLSIKRYNSLMKTTDPKFNINKFFPCGDAVKFYANYSSFEDAWNACPRGDWMLWIAKKLGVDVKTLTRAKAKCALTVRDLMKDKRSLKACEVALKFADGEATRKELDAAAYAADAAYAAVYVAADAADAAAYAAYAAADAAAAYVAADAAAYAAAYAADPAAYAADAADVAAAVAAYGKNRLETANICREVLTEEVFKLISKGQ